MESRTRVCTWIGLALVIFYKWEVCVGSTLIPLALVFLFFFFLLFSFPSFDTDTRASRALSNSPNVRVFMGWL